MKDLPGSVLVVGSGGREHALVRAIAASPRAPRVLCAPGNPGIAEEAACFPVKADNLKALCDLAKKENVEFVVVGPEVPLSLGLADRLAKLAIPVYGPGAAGARLEASKTFTKRLLLKYAIPTAAAGFFRGKDAAVAHLRAGKLPVVLKADGLAAGKGVVVAASLAEAEAAAADMLEGGKFGEGGRRILVEECLTGEETSILVVVSGRDFVVLPTSQDHKRAGDGDTGPNTGGMGAYSPAEVVTPALLDEIVSRIVRPSVDAIASEGIKFCGTLFIGVMLTPDGPKVLEFNTRFGDPETQAVLPRLESDFLALLWAAAQGGLAGYRLKVRKDPAICVVLCAKGYPDSYSSGDEIRLPKELPPGATLLHAGTARDSAGRLVTSGGRVLGAAATAASLQEAARRAYAACESVSFDSKYYRRDIGARQLGRG
ncbi:MAG TPA: phosphoribosylamine--glycine ligase [Opitutaceae bacterium]